MFRRGRGPIDATLKDQFRTLPRGDDAAPACCFMLWLLRRDSPTSRRTLTVANYNRNEEVQTFTKKRRLLGSSPDGV
jgi:hypothetical protein